MSGTIGSRGSDVPVGTISTNNVVASSVVLGSNVSLTTSTLSVGNSTVNTVANSSAVYISGNAVSPYSMRNRIINGDMRVWQRGTSFSNPNSLTTAYSADRWAFYRSGYTANIAGTQTTSLTINGNNRNALRVQRTSGDTNTALVQCSQQIESQNIRDLAGQTVTLSAWVRVGANFSGGTLSMFIYTGTGTDEGLFSAGFTGITAASSIAIPSSATSYTKFTTTTTLASNINEAAVQFYYGPSGTAGANDWFEITDVQLEAGSVATPFERRPYGMELALCQRYYQVIPATYSLGYSAGNSVTQGGGMYNLKVTMRAAPTVDPSKAGAFTMSAGSAGTVGLQYSTTDTVNIWNTSSNWTASQTCVLSGALGLVAEL